MKLQITTRVEENGADIQIFAEAEGLSAQVRVPCHVRKLPDEEARAALERFRQAAIGKLLKRLGEKVKAACARPH